MVYAFGQQVVINILIINFKVAFKSYSRGIMVLFDKVRQIKGINH